MKTFDTLAVHAGCFNDAYGAVTPPIYTSSTYRQTSPGVPGAYEYARVGNPTRDAFEQAVAALEGGMRGFGFASGLAACSTILDLLDQGAHIIAVDDLYGGTHRLLEQVRKRTAGLEVTYVVPDDVAGIEAAVRSNTRMLWVETPTNPLLKLADLKALADVAKRHALISVVDNTFATPYIQRPLAFGFDIVVHSVTKYLSGHSDVVAGVAVVGDAPKLAEQLGFLQNAVGGIIDPFSSFFALRGIRTLALRMARHSENALTIAQWLEQQPQVSRVFYPGLQSHAQHALAERQMRAYGGVISIELAGDEVYVREVVAKLRLFTLAESLGGVESLICQPSSMTHAAMPEAQRLAVGVTSQLLRLSVGIEDVDELIEDLATALAD